jgi:hypothetical protein
MTEADIRGNGLALLGLLHNYLLEDVPPAHKANADVFVSGAGNILVQAFVDLNRIASALEQIALNGIPGSKL